jgi:ketopantoate reductase
MKILIVGRGAVGQVYGLTLQNSGIILGFFDRSTELIKPNSVQEQHGFSLYQLSNKSSKKPVVHSLTAFKLISNISESRDFKPDQIWFTTPSQVYASDWFREFVQQVPSKRVVCFSPEGMRKEFFFDQNHDRFVFGGTTFMAWKGDLADQKNNPNDIHFWLSPIAVPLVGSSEACREVAEVLKMAGFIVSIGKPDSHLQASTTAVMTSFTAGLELAGWSLATYRKKQWIHCAAGACHEALLGQLTELSAITRLFLDVRFLSVCFKLATLILPLLPPFDLEKYLKFHYTKTHQQTLHLLELFRDDSKLHDIVTINCQALLMALLSKDSSEYR